MKRFCLLLVFLTAILSGCAMNTVNSYTTGVVVYDRYGVSFEEELTPEEIQAVSEVLSGKGSEPAIFGTPSCGFDKNVAIILNGRRYALACDGCGTVQDFGTLGYIHISDEEQDILERIFTSRGGEFPCI